MKLAPVIILLLATALVALVTPAAVSKGRTPRSLSLSNDGTIEEKNHGALQVLELLYSDVNREDHGSFAADVGAMDDEDDGHGFDNEAVYGVVHTDVPDEEEKGILEDNGNSFTEFDLLSDGEEGDNVRPKHRVVRSSSRGRGLSRSRSASRSRSSSRSRSRSRSPGHRTRSRSPSRSRHLSGSRPRSRSAAATISGYGSRSRSPSQSRSRYVQRSRSSGSVSTYDSRSPAASSSSSSSGASSALLNILVRTTEGALTRSGRLTTQQYHRVGSYEQALNDFNSLRGHMIPRTIHTTNRNGYYNNVDPVARVNRMQGRLTDGRMVIARRGTPNERPTLEIRGTGPEPFHRVIRYDAPLRNPDDPADAA